MKKFWNDLKIALFARGIMANRGNCIIDRDGKYRISNIGFQSTLRLNTTCHNLYIYPSPYIPHCMIVKEVWIGLDCNGDTWRDDKGGIRIDCTGLNCSRAIEKIANKIAEQWKEYFTYSKKH